MTSNQAKLKRQYESELAQNIQSMLVKALGPDKTVVRVNMDLDFNQEQVKEENFVPATANAAAPGAAPATAAEAKGVLLSQQTTKEEYNGAVTPMGGATGKITVGKTTGNPNDSYIRSESSAEYGVTKTVKETVNAPGQVTRRSVAVLVDEKVPVSKIGVIKEIVRTAAGIDETKKDQITVQQIKFDDSAEKAAAAEMASVSKTGMMTAIAKNAGAAVLLVLFLFFLKKTIKQIKVQVPAPVPVAAQQTPADMLAGTNPADLLAMMKQQGYSPDSNEQSGAKYSTLVKPDNSLPPEIEQSNPEELARLVRSWMSEQ
jgi:flagellar M-ring protein FliF